jgi:mono/diheme cytochrome c family protein
MFAKIVNALELVTLAGVVVFVIFLFTNEPGSAGAGGPGAGGPGAQLFQANCARCHGASGEGGIGPKLAGRVVITDFPYEPDQIALVAKGRGAMPAFAGMLSPQQLKQVVDYTRTSLGR